MREQTKPKNNRILRIDDVMAVCGYKRTQLFEKIGRREFPAPIRLSESGRAIGWLQQEVDEWLAARIAARDKKAASR